MGILEIFSLLVIQWKSQRGDYKAEFIQSCVGFIPCLIAFQQLDTLYLGGNNVRVVCEKSVKNSSV